MHHRYDIDQARMDLNRRFLVMCAFLALAAGCSHQEKPTTPTIPQKEMESTHQMCFTYDGAAWCFRTVKLPSGESKVELIRLTGKN